MAAVADLHVQRYAKFYYLLVVEGLPYAFANEGPHIWSTTYVTDRTILPGLVVPKKLVVGTDPREGPLERNRTDFQLVDFDRSTLVSMLRSEWDLPGDDGDVLFDCIRATEDPGPASVATNQGNTSVNPRGMHVGIEYIASDGTRRSRWIAPSDTAGPIDHKVYGDTQYGLPPVYATDEAYTFRGRKVALYRIVQDNDGTWPSWSDQYAGGSMIWFGTVNDAGDVDATESTFQFQCAGPDSWYRRTLNRDAPRVLGQLKANITITDGSDDTLKENAVGIAFSIWQGGELFDSFEHSEAAFDAADDLTAGELDVETLASEIDAIIQKYIDAGADNYHNGNQKRVASMAPDGSFIVIGINEQTDYVYGSLELCMHHKVWARLGWDPVAQRELRTDDQGGAAKFGFNGDDRGVLAVTEAGIRLHYAGEYHYPPAPGYIRVQFITVSRSASSGDDWDNNEAPRQYSRFFEQPVAYLDRDGQAFASLVEGDNVWLEGQNVGAGPFDLAGVNEVDSTAVDRMRLFALVGKIVRQGDGSVEDYAQIVRAEWVLDNDTFDRELIGADGDGNRGFAAGKWVEPYLFGLPHRPVTEEGAWVVLENAVSILPLACWGGYIVNNSVPGHRHNVLTSLLLSSGTAGVMPAGFVPASVGDNAPSGMDDVPDQVYGNDREIADLGMNIPAQWVDWQGILEEAKKLPGGVESPLNRWMMAVNGPIDGEELIRGLLQGAGWAMSWKKSSSSKVHQFGVFTMFEHLAPGDAEIVIEEEDYAGDPYHPESWKQAQSLRWWAPVDEFVFRYGWNPLEGSTTGERRLPSFDRSKASRHSRVTFEVQDPGLYDEEVVKAAGKQAKPGLTWTEAALERFQRQFADWIEERNFSIELEVQADKAFYAGPGSIVRYTDTSRPANPFGSYGLTNHMGRVIQVEHDTDDRSARLTVVFQARSTSTFRVWAPIARVFGVDDLDTPTTLYLDGPWDGDWMGNDEPNWSDAKGFVKSAWMSGSGNAVIDVYQSEDFGETWPASYVCTATVTGADTDNHTLTVSSWSGTYYRSMLKFAVLRPHASQSATWPQNHYSVVTDEDGLFGATQGFALL